MSVVDDWYVILCFLPPLYSSGPRANPTWQTGQSCTSRTGRRPTCSGPLRRPGCVLRGVHPRRRDRQVAHTYQETNGGRRITFRPGCVLIRAIQRTRPFFPPQLEQWKTQKILSFLRNPACCSYSTACREIFLGWFDEISINFSVQLLLPHRALFLDLRLHTHRDRERGARRVRGR
jgi:hypothetical protein